MPIDAHAVQVTPGYPADDTTDTTRLDKILDDLAARVAALEAASRHQQK